MTDDGLTYTFQLHEQVKWWDGHDLTAEYVSFSIKRMIALGEPRPRVGLLRPFIESVEVLDRHRVQIRLKYPSPSFLKFLAFAYMKIVPKHVIEAGVDINRWENIVGSGPFKTKRARRGDSVTHEKNPTYFKPGRPYLDTLTVRPINDQGTIAAALRTEKVHMTSASFNLSVEDVLKLELELQGKYTVHWQPGVNNGIHFFVNVEKEPWTDLRLIKALRLATDQQEIQKAFGEGKFYQGAPFPVASWYGSPPDELASRPGYQSPKAPDIEAAKALLKEAGYDPPSKLGKRVILTTPPWIVPDLAQLWAAQMRRNLGLDIETKRVDTPSGVTAYVAGDYDIGIWGYGVNISDPDDWVNAIYGLGARNYTRWKNPDFLKLFDQQSRELDRTKRRKLLCQMEEFLLTVEDPYIQVMWVYWFYMVSDKVRTEVGPFVPAPTIQIVLKQEHWWLET